jgi:hypothetical protein
MGSCLVFSPLAAPPRPLKLASPTPLGTVTRPPDRFATLLGPGRDCRSPLRSTLSQGRISRALGVTGQTGGRGLTESRMHSRNWVGGEKTTGLI